MATKQKQVNGKTTHSQSGNASFADVKYSEQDKTAFSDWLMNQDVSPIDALDTLTADLYRVSFKADIQNNCQMVSITQQDEKKHKNSGIILIVRGSTNEKAVLLAAWTIFEMFHSEPLPLQMSSGDFWI